MASSTQIRPAIGRILQHANKRNPSTSLALPIFTSRTIPTSPFSTTSQLQERKPRRDNNRLRGLSSLYRSGTKARLAVDGYDVPVPAKYKPEDDIKTDPNHGLWEFFYDKEKALLTPEEERKHGRSWTVEELRHKSWEDLHSLWWVCVKERNRVATAGRERIRLEFKLGEEESIQRMRTVSKTMKAIKHTLTERYYAWEDARTLAETDSEIQMSSETNSHMYTYTPREYLEEEVTDPEALEAEVDARVRQEELEKPSVEKIDPSTLTKTPEIPPTSARS